MAFVADIIIVAILVLSVFLGYKRGFVKTLFGCCSLVVAILLAAVFGGPVGGIIKNSPLFDGISEGVKKEITQQVDTLAAPEVAETQTVIDGEISDIPNENLSQTPDSTKLSGRKIIEDFANTDFGRTVFRLGVDEEQIMNDFGNAIDNGIETVMESDNFKAMIVGLIAGPVLDCVAAALGTVIVFILSLIILKICCYFLDKIFKLPLLSSVNKYGGIAAGVVSGLITVFALCMAADALIPVLPSNPVIYTGMENDTLLYSFFTSINPVALFVF